MNVRRTSSVVALVAALPIVLAACGSSTTTAPAAPAAAPSSSSSAPSSSSSAPSTTSPSDTATSSAAGGATAKTFGAGCAAVPADGKGSFKGMATDPVATAASNNPVLSTLVTAVGAAGLADTLNSTKDITVFAPSNDAFAKIPADTLKGVLADKATLTKILTGHVIAGRLSPEKLAGDHKTLAGNTVTVAGSGEAFTVGKDKAKVICGNVQTANATVYIIDSVLMP
ncbi:fasciclin domain-containing protein [Lapillicoccus sp.]|uniref:fasciclin domain-containing protein n=1 Tax=Lapillicoccus sp. TaxID=1909287 RepID=UPI003983AB94